MAVYEYHALAPNGEPVHGTLAVEDQPAAERELTRRGLTNIQLSLRSEADLEDSLHGEQLEALVQAVGAGAASRIPIEMTLAALAEERSDTRLADVAEKLGAQLERGATIDQAMSDLQTQLPTEVAGLLRAGIASGDLAGTLERFAEQRLASQRIGRRIRAVIAYPLLIAAILVPLLLFLSLRVIPMFTDVFDGFEMELPQFTMVVLETSKQTPALIGGLLLFVLVMPIVLRLVGGRWLFQRVRTALPVVGQLWMWAGQREFSAQLASFLHRELPMADAVAYTGEVLSDRNLARACRRITLRLEAGQPLSHCLSQSIHFDRSLVAIITWGERNGVLPEALAIATDMFDDRIDQQARLIRRLLPPITMIGVGTLMFFLIVSLMVPLFKLIEGLSK